MLGRAIQAVAARTPAQAAVVFNGEAVSYGAFAGWIDRAAALFGALGGDGVAVLAASHLFDAWVMSLGLRELGLTVMPAAYAADVATMSVRNVRIVIAHAEEDWSGLDEACAQRGWPLLRVSRADVAAAAGPWRRAEIPGGHILRTSGTTGAYKNVLMDPAWELDFHQWRAGMFGVTDDDVAAVFDFPLWTGLAYKGAGEVWVSGGTVVINQARPAWEGLERPDLTHAHLTPPVLAQVLEAPPGALIRRENLFVGVAAGGVSEAQAEAARQRITGRLYSSMGSTETMTFALTHLRTAQDRRWLTPVAGRDLQIVDDADQPVPAGTIGRLRLGTAGGPTGYLDDPEATAAFFRHGYFYPGDLAELGAEGRMALHGRVTDVLNHRGIKIAPAPIEETLRDRLGVTAACLFSRANDDGEEEIHIVLEAASPLPAATLTSVIQDELRGFAAARVHYLAALPRNDMGKVMRARVQMMVTSPR